MKIVIGIAAGLLWGTLIALLNSKISRKALAAGTTGAVMTANFVRSVVNVAALAAVFLLRKALPFSFEAAIISTAVALGLLTVLFALRLAKSVGEKTPGEKEPAPAAGGEDADEAETALPGEKKH